VGATTNTGEGDDMSGTWIGNAKGIGSEYGIEMKDDVNKWKETY
jgi:hypothetical protein